MFLVPADYEGLKKKHVDSKIFERDEEGFFERVVSVHPLGLEDMTIEFNPVYVLYERHLKFRSSKGFRKLWSVVTLPFFFLSLIHQLVEITRIEKVNIIRANDPYWIGFLGVIVKKIIGVPLCISIHCDYDHCYKITGSGNSYTLLGFRYPAVLLSRFVLKRADLVLPIRNTLAQWALNNGAQVGTTRVIPHGIDFSIYERVNVDLDWLPVGMRNKRTITFIGRLSKENYVHQFPEIIKRLLNRRDDFVFILAGDGELTASLEAVLRDNPLLREHLLLLGFQDQKKCFSLQKSSDVCLALMGGFSLIEACAAARPVISYDVEWHYELVMNDHTGFLINENDIDAVVNAIDSLLSNENLAAHMGKNAEKLVREKHDIHLTSRIKRDCYKELLQ